MGLILGGVSARDLILDSQSVSLYIGGSPPVNVWPTIREVVQITLGTRFEARDQFRAALADRGMNYQTIKYIPFDIEFVGTGSTEGMFRNCYALTSVPAMDTSNVTYMGRMFQDCSSLTHVSDMYTSNVTNMLAMFSGCAALTDGNVRLIGKYPIVNTTTMIDGSGLTREPFFDTAGNPI